MNPQHARWFVLNCFIVLIILNGVGNVAAAGVIRRGVGPEPGTVEPHSAQGLSALNVVRDLYEGLTTLDAAGQMIPGAAESWTVKSDGYRYEFVLRPDIKWSDGSSLTASDFVRGLRHALNGQNPVPYAGLLDIILNAKAVRRGELPESSLGIKALDQRRVQINLESPSPHLLQVLTHPVSYPLHRRGPHAAYNGAFKLVERKAQTHLRLAPNPYFHAADSVKLDEVYWIVSEDSNSELAHYRVGELHITATIPPGRFKWLNQNMSADLRVSPYLGTYYLAFNLTSQKFKDHAKLRQALSLAIDRATLTRVVTASGEQEAFGLVAPGLKDYTYPEQVYETMTQEERLGLAKALYRQSGYNDENPLRITLRYNTSALQRRIAAAVSAMWREYLGVVTELYNEEWKVFINSRKQRRNTEIVRGGWIADMADPVSFLEPFASDSYLNYTGYSDPLFDQWLRRAANAKNPFQRGDALTRAEARLLSQHAIIPIYYYVSRHLVNPKVQGYVANVMDIHMSRYLSLAGQR